VPTSPVSIALTQTSPSPCAPCPSPIEKSAPSVKMGRYKVVPATSSLLSILPPFRRGGGIGIPRQWKVIQTVREKFSCRECEKITQSPAPFHVTPRGFAGTNLLAMVLFEKFGQHQPLNRQSERYRREGIDLSVSTLADQVGACTAALQPLHALIETHVLAAERLHGDDTTVPILAKGKTVTSVTTGSP